MIERRATVQVRALGRHRAKSNAVSTEETSIVELDVELDVFGQWAVFRNGDKAARSNILFHDRRRWELASSCPISALPGFQFAFLSLGQLLKFLRPLLQLPLFLFFAAAVHTTYVSFCLQIRVPSA